MARADFFPISSAEFVDALMIRCGQHGTAKTARTVVHLAPGYWAGDPRLYHLECSSLIDAGYQVEVIAQGALEEIGNFSIRLSSLGQYGHATLGWRLMERVKRDQTAYRLAVNSNADLYHFHSPEFIPWGLRLKRTSKRPVIFDCREDYEGYARQRRGIPAVLRPALARWVRSKLSKAARKLDAVITADQGTANQFAADARRVVVIHNFPRLELFPRSDVYLSSRPYDLVYHGSIPKYHLEVCLAVDDVLEQRGHRLRWRFISKAIPEINWFRAELRRRGIEERFRIDDRVPHDQIGREISKAKIGIIPLPNLPKFLNNIPRKLFEFMAMELPVVMSDLPPSRPFVSNGSCGFMVPPADYAAYADAIIELVKNPDLRCAMGKEGRRRVEQGYNWEKESRKLLALYDELLAA
jgi:glycosyltransferase involved in cell wall biosynthesis